MQSKLSSKRMPTSDSAMLPGMSRKPSAKPRITIVGAGNLANALALSLHVAGYEIEQIVSRGHPSSLRRARRLAHEVGATAVTISRARIQSEVVWFCVPDRAIATAAKSIAACADWTGKVALHSSGALASDELTALRSQGAAIASVHPLMTFVPGSRPSLAGVPFAVEGDSAAVRAARRIVKNLGGHAYSIQKEDKAACHAWGTFASPLLTALLVTSEHVAAAAGIERKTAKKMMLPIVRQTLANYADLEAEQAFSGPLIRGDIETVKRHLHTLRKLPVAQDVYLSLARAALAHLPGKNKRALEQALKSARNISARNLSTRITSRG
jgi:predicted short-subunit dehydrogenase-like oxidoreductase (DUF2520 family)